MNEAQINTKIEQSDIEFTEEQKIEPIYSNEKEKNGQIEDLNNKSSNLDEKQVLDNEEQIGEKLYFDENKNVEISKENLESIENKKENNNLIDNFQQDEEFPKENNIIDNNKDEAYNEDYSDQENGNNIHKQEGYTNSNHEQDIYYPNYQIPQTFPYQDYYNPHISYVPNYPHYPPLLNGSHFQNYSRPYRQPQDPLLLNNQNPLPSSVIHGPHYINNSSLPHGPHLPYIGDPIYQPHNAQFHPYNPQYPPSVIQIHNIVPEFPQNIQPFPPHGEKFPFEPYIPSQDIPFFPPNVFPPHGPFPPNVVPPHGPLPPNVFPPHGPFPPNVFPPYPPYGNSIYPPHGFPHKPYYLPHFGPHFMPPPNDEFHNQNKEEDEKDVGFSSDNGQINIYNKNQKQFYNNSIKDDYNGDMLYNSNEYGNNNESNEFQPYLYDYYNYYGNNQIFGFDNYINDEQSNTIKHLEESKSIEDKINIKLNYERIPLYVDAILSETLMNENIICFPKIKPQNYTNSIPIVIIHNPDFYQLFLEFLKSNSIYKEFNSFPVLKNKLILSKDDIYIEHEESHFPKNINLLKFADITDSFQLPLYIKEDQDDIIKEIKKNLGNDENYFTKFINSWINLVMDLIVEFIKFKLKKISYSYYCNICHFPCFYLSDYIENEFNIEEDINKLIINDTIYAFNELMGIINIKNSDKKKENIINVICYEEEYNYMNYSFESEINGTFINCNNIKSFNKIMNEINDRNIFIQNKNSKIESKIKYNITNNYMFELIISSIYIDKIFQYLINNNFFRFIKGICFLIDNKNNNNNINNNLLEIKKKYNNYLKDIYIEQNDVIQFLKNAKEGMKYRNNQKFQVKQSIINYINYSLKYLNFHKNISFYYNKYPTNPVQIFENIILDFLKTIDIIKNQSQNSKSSNQKNNKKNIDLKKNKLNNILNVFIKIKQKLSLSDNIEKKKNEINRIINNNLEKYEQNLSLLISDFNIWLNTPDNISLEKLSYFIGSLMYTIDTCLCDNNINYEENINDNEKINKEKNITVLYKEFIGNYIDILIHENNKYKIVTFPNFLVCSNELMNISKKDEDNFNIIYIIKLNMSNKDDFVQILFDLNDGKKVFQMFTFFKINDIKIKRCQKKLMVYLEPINKKEYLELKLTLDDNIIYNYVSNIMETIKYNTSIKHDDNSDNTNNLYITANEQLYDNYNEQEDNNGKITKYMRYFNNKYGTNLNTEMTSLSLEESNMKNMGLLILSKTNLENLIVLNLNKNNISDISPFKNCNFPKLKKLSLESDEMSNPQDKITDISPLIHCNFPELFILNLKNNLISDISYLLFMNFPNLIILDMSHNQIESVYVFNEVNFPNLETLDLNNNFITDISPFISSGKKKQNVKNIDSSSFLNSSNISNFLSKSVSNNEMTSKSSILPSLKILKIKNNKITIDERYLMTIKALKSRGITIYK